MPHPDFINATGYPNTASIGLPPGPVLKAMQTAVGEWGRGDATAPRYDDYVWRARTLFAAMHGVLPADVAIGPQVSYFTGLVAQTLKPGAEVVAYEGDFASLLWPFLVRGDLDVRLVPLEAVVDAIRPSTDLVAVSAVQSADGRVAELRALSRAAREHDAVSVIDATRTSTCHRRGSPGSARSRRSSIWPSST